MRLVSITVRNYRVHKELAVDFDASRNLIGGPNESGKSTLVEAIHRALFLRSKTGGSVQREMVSSVHLGDPEVRLVFESGGTCWELEKRFAGKKGSTILSAKGKPTLHHEEAEDALESILGVSGVTGRGAAGALPSLWSHLWVWQGTSGDDPAAQATEHKEKLVSRLQNQSNGAAAVLESATDQRVAARISNEHDELFTATGKPKAGSAPELARTRMEQAKAVLDTAQAAAARLAEAVDDQERATREAAKIKSLLPGLREQLVTARKRLEEAVSLRKSEMELAKAAQDAANKRAELEGYDAKIRDLLAKHAAAAVALEPADEKLANLKQAADAARDASLAAEAKHREASVAVRQARLHHDFSTASMTASERQESLRQITKRANEAKAIHDELVAKQAALAKLPVLAGKELARLRKLETQAAQSAAKLEAMATSVELIESPGMVWLDGKAIAPGESRVITEDGELSLGDGTRLRIRPGGGASLESARSDLAAARDGLSFDLNKLGVADTAQAAAVVEQRLALGPQISSLEARWQSLGGDDLADQLVTATAARDAARAELERRAELAGVTPDTPADPTQSSDALAAAEAAESRARTQAQMRHERHESASAELANHREMTEAARRMLHELAIALQTRREEHGDDAARAQALANACDAEARAAAAHATAKDLLAALQPAQLEADADRFTRAIAALETQLRDAENLALIAGDRLKLDGTSDPEADVSRARAAWDSASRDYQAKHQHALAIARLHELFTSSREAIDRALVQPLADRVSGYLQCVFGPGARARVELDGGGVSNIALDRDGEREFAFATLSGGAREQVAAAFRLALAEILAAGHDGCLPVVFDDAFAFSDASRIQSLQRMLDLAARRGLQVIVFTCAPGEYAAFGVPVQWIGPRL